MDAVIVSSEALSSNAFWAVDAASDVAVPVAWPRLPMADSIFPYLRRIDATRRYSNCGPLIQEFEARLAAHGAGVGAATVANATIGLALALMAQEPPPGSLCMVPSWSFAASAHAARLAGLTPWLVDVDPDNWALTPRLAAGLLRGAPGAVGAVMPVIPFGSPTDSSQWDAFRDATGIAVVIDAAAAFDTVRASSVPQVVSLHATKVLGIGEGGFVVCNDTALLDDVRRRGNFGFWRTREAAAAGLNGKLSEYAAAIGLAALDDWPLARAAYARVVQRYRVALAGISAVARPMGYDGDWVSSTVIARVPERALAPVMVALAGGGIGFRLWWGGGLHRHAAFRTFPRTPMPVTDSLVETTIGLPCWPDLPDGDIDRIGAMIRAVCAKCAQLGTQR